MPHESSKYHAFNSREIKTRAEYARVITPIDRKMRTKQSGKDDCDINLMVKRHASTGLWDHVSPRAPTFGDFSGSRELADAIEQVDLAEALFAELPAEVRRLCDNNPVNLLSGLADPESYEMLVKAGLPGLQSRLAEPPEVPAAPMPPNLASTPRPEPDPPEGS